LRDNADHPRNLANALPLQIQDPDFHRCSATSKRLLYQGLPHAGVGQIYLKDSGSDLHDAHKITRWSDTFLTS
jgi:hypothetical protein